MHSTSQHSRIIIVLSLFVVFVVACKPEIHDFKASPNHICRGQSTTLTWDVSGVAILSARPFITKTGLVQSSSSDVFILNHTTYFTISVFRNDYLPKRGQVQVKVFSNNDEKEIVPWTEPSSSGGLVATASEVWGEIGDIMVIDRVYNTSDRALIVMHEGKEFSLSVNGFSDELRGMKISGTWKIYADLKPGEVIGDPNHPPPDRLRILVKIHCKGQ